MPSTQESSLLDRSPTPNSLNTLVSGTFQDTLPYKTPCLGSGCEKREVGKRRKGKETDGGEEGDGQEGEGGMGDCAAHYLLSQPTFWGVELCRKFWVLFRPTFLSVRNSAFLSCMTCLN